MFDKILIANRGEIACRVIETARKLGVRTVAVYSDADAGARHVEMADEAVHIGPPAPSESYLRIDRIIAAARDTGAQGIHPGYGFLSENPEFVEACDQAGIAFIGPSAGAIRAMGLKDAAKKLMEEAGVPVVPGYHGDEQDDDLLAAEAGKIGYPVLIKAVAGGGGKGMRLVEAAADFAGALKAARNEARAAFGNDAVLIEKFVTHPRHIEVQVFGDGQRAVHLFERDCSLQRRHQKVIEEAPAPGMTEEVRAAMGAAAVRAAEAIGYAGAGTVEFIVDGSGALRTDGFWFMEMNTRLQVEHPVTEEITGIDLVEWQLRVASGEPLPLSQDQITMSGHAFEARLYAEDAPAGFLPATGPLLRLHLPEGARNDTGVREGDSVTPHYDPMIAKITVHGKTRAMALRRFRAALAATRVAGTVTNLDFLRALAAHEGFGRGEVDTGLIGRDRETLVDLSPPSTEVAALAALAALGEEAAGQPMAGFSLWANPRHEVRFSADGQIHHAHLSFEGNDRVRVTLGEGEAVELQRRALGWQAGSVTAELWRQGDRVAVFADRTWMFDRIDPLQAAGSAATSADAVLSPMPGLVREVFVAPGQTISRGERLAVMEAMKMEHSLTAPRDGVVAEVPVAAGDQIEAQVVLVTLEPETADG